MQATVQTINQGVSTNGIAQKISETEAHHLADAYAKTALGSIFTATEGRLTTEQNEWSFSLQCHFADLVVPAGYIRVQASTGKVVPLAQTTIWDIQARTLLFAEHRRGHNPARGEDGLIMPYQAKVKVNAYVSDTIAFFARSTAGAPTFIPGKPPCWRVQGILHLPKYGMVADLGTVDVNAVSGQVIPLTPSEIHSRQEQARHAAQCAQRATTTAE